jgi:hypothetical protein
MTLHTLEGPSISCTAEGEYAHYPLTKTRSNATPKEGFKC